MHPPYLVTRSTILLATLLSVSAAGAQEARPADSAPRVHKLTIMNGWLPTVTYFVRSGSPHQQALYRSLQFTENELTLVEGIQRLRIEDVAIPMNGWSQGSGWRSGYNYCGYAVDSSYPPIDSAQQLIGLREAIQTELARARKPMALQNRKAPHGQAEAVAKARAALLQWRAVAAPGRPVARIPSFSSVCARLAAQPRLGPAMPYARTAIARTGIPNGYR